MKDVIWDSALVYPPGANWGAVADFLAAPVVKFRGELDAALDRGAQARDTAGSTRR
jgi:hypothetical protein